MFVLMLMFIVFIDLCYLGNINNVVNIFLLFKKIIIKSVKY